MTGWSTTGRCAANAARLDRYVASLNVPAATYQGWSRDEKVAFWLNGYNAIVLQTVINNYPIRGKSGQYPQNEHPADPGGVRGSRSTAWRRTSLTLDEIEKTVLPGVRRSTRVSCARARRGRQRTAAQRGLHGPQARRSSSATVQSEFVPSRRCSRIDRLTGRITVTPIISWREAEFVKAYDKGAEGPHAQRSPIERAVIAFITPHLLRIERSSSRRTRSRCRSTRSTGVSTT